MRQGAHLAAETTNGYIPDLSTLRTARFQSVRPQNFPISNGVPEKSAIRSLQQRDAVSGKLNLESTNSRKALEGATETVASSTESFTVLPGPLPACLLPPTATPNMPDAGQQTRESFDEGATNITFEVDIPQCMSSVESLVPASCATNSVTVDSANTGTMPDGSPALNGSAQDPSLKPSAITILEHAGDPVLSVVKTLLEGVPPPSNVWSSQKKASPGFNGDIAIHANAQIPSMFAKPTSGSAITCNLNDHNVAESSSTIPIATTSNSLTVLPSAVLSHPAQGTAQSPSNVISPDPNAGLVQRSNRTGDDPNSSAKSDTGPCDTDTQTSSQQAAVTQLGHHTDVATAILAPAALSPAQTSSVAPLAHAATPMPVKDATPGIQTEDPTSRPAIGNQPLSSQGAPDTAFTLGTARLTQQVGHTEMTIGIHSTEFGSISIRTSSTRDQVSADLSVDHHELGTALLNHLPYIQGRLGSDRPIEMRIHQSGSSDAPSGQAGGSGGASQDSGRRAYPTQTTNARTVGPSLISAERPEPPGVITPHADLRLDVRA